MIFEGRNGESILTLNAFREMIEFERAMREDVYVVDPESNRHILLHEFCRTNNLLEATLDVSENSRNSFV